MEDKSLSKPSSACSMLLNSTKVGALNICHTANGPSLLSSSIITRRTYFRHKKIAFKIFLVKLHLYFVYLHPDN